ncbi:P-loop containing nucleoside triphosphate hydrolase protein [Auriculariales sp. MPI-PUGE-AT-0066]|nr:P-loop containing nucleoside triphosphate hydrolase protein [Auriculariales sp. MPI-PUGE-AT-0066]
MAAKTLLQKERDAVVEQAHLLISNCGPKLLEARGLALLNLSVVNTSIGLGGKTLIELERPTAFSNSPIFPPHTFRPGDLAQIDEHSSGSMTAKPRAKTAAKKAGADASKDTTSAIEGVVYKVSDTRIIIAADGERNQDIELPARCKLQASVKLANTATFDRMDKAIYTLEKNLLGTANPPASSATPGPTTVANMNLVRVLVGEQPRSLHQAVTDLTFLDASLNPSQQTAVRFALESIEVACIHGPPGTGKTHTLVEIVRQLVARNKSVLICGASNLAVDNLLERLVRHQLAVTRIGHPARVMETLHNSTLDAQTARSEQFVLAQDVKKDIDNAMNVLSGKGKGKLRGPERRKMWDEVKELRKEYRKREGGVVTSVLKQAKVVLATCHGAGGRQLHGRNFDVVIIDEATQALEAVSWIPIFKGHKLILAGDNCQLPPTVISTGQKKRAAKITKPTATKVGKPTKKVQTTPTSPPAEAQTPDSQSDDSADGGNSDSAPETTVTVQLTAKIAAPKRAAAKGTLTIPKSLEVTLFDRLEQMYGPDVKRMLTMQYRMHEQIARFPSKTLYSNALVAHESVAKHKLSELPSCLSGSTEASDALDVPVVFFDTAGCQFFERLEGESTDGGPQRGAIEEGSRCNENEAEVVRRWVQELVDAGVTPDQIALITPYQAQVTLLSSLLKPTMPDLEIGSVDGMQGREKEAVILSLVRSNEKCEVGFLKDKRRLNVAMTRARRQLCVVGDSSTIVHGGKYLKSWMAWLEANADVRYAGLD